MEVTYQVGRKLFEKTADYILNSVETKDEKDINKKLLTLVDWTEKLMGDSFRKSSYEKTREFIKSDDQKWKNYIKRGLKEIHPNVLKTHAMSLGYESALYGYKQVQKNREKYNANIPWVILMDPTSACNLKCTGCWAAEYGNKSNLSFEEMDDIVTQAKELGIHFFMFTGGEPLIRKDDILKLCEKHNDCAFHTFTNGTLIDEEFCKKTQEVGNLSFGLSVEGFEEANDGRRGDGSFEKVMDAMDLMKEYGLAYGTSICYTSQNYDVVTSDEFYDLLIDKGVRFSWYFHYMPVGKNASVDLLPSKEQREHVYRRIREIRGYEGGKEIFLMDFQNDGRSVGGCIAGGRRYMHINSNGDVEPCVFVHYSGANIRDMPLLDTLKQPLFEEYRKRIPFNDNHFKPCPMLENPDYIVDMVNRTNAKSTDLEAPEDVEDLVAKTRSYANQWDDKADELWDEVLVEKMGK